MNFYVLITDNGMYINDRLPCLKKYKDKLCIIKFSSDISEMRQGIKLINTVSDDKQEYSLIKEYENYKQQCVNVHVKEILQSTEKEMILLVDANLEELYLLDLLQKSSCKRIIHLIILNPNNLLTKGTVHDELLSNLSGVKSLAIYDPYKMAMDKYGNIEKENIQNIVDKQTAYLLEKIKILSEATELWGGIGEIEDSKYFFDIEKQDYIDTQSLRVLDTGYIGGGIMGEYIETNNEDNKYLLKNFQVPVPRPDGKKICSHLRFIREMFAQLNNIEYEFRECDYTGPCAGTCQLCDNEARELLELAEQSGNVKYPEISLEEFEL